MGGNITIKLPKGSSPDSLADQIRSVLAKAGYSNIQLNVKTKPQYDLSKGNNAINLALGNVG